jgi:hypothetical protein
MAGREKVKEYELSRTLVKNGRRVKAIRLGGYVGKKEKGLVRLYASQEFSDYLDIDEKNILDARDAPKEMFGEGGTYIWISKDAEVIRGREEENVNIRFLEGEISEEFLRSAEIALDPQIDICAFHTCGWYTCHWYTCNWYTCRWFTCYGFTCRFHTCHYHTWVIPERQLPGPRVGPSESAGNPR